MRPTTAPTLQMIDLDLNALVHPGTLYEHPRDVLADPPLSLAEKRAILASWASDASAIASCPALRAPEGVQHPVSIDRRPTTQVTRTPRAFRNFVVLKGARRRPNRPRLLLCAPLLLRQTSRSMLSAQCSPTTRSLRYASCAQWSAGA